MLGRARLRPSRPLEYAAPADARTIGAGYELTQYTDRYLVQRRLMLHVNSRLHFVQSTSYFAGQDSDEWLPHHVGMITWTYFDIHAAHGDASPAQIVRLRCCEQALRSRPKKRNLARIATGFVLRDGIAMGIDHHAILGGKGF